MQPQPVSVAVVARPAFQPTFLGLLVGGPQPGVEKGDISQKGRQQAARAALQDPGPGPSFIYISNLLNELGRSLNLSVASPSSLGKAKLF